ncbi:putative DNA helicase ino80 [Lambiella insularis]|nr:putative DNA helicase ino80 [Lambiella insularis]
MTSDVSISACQPAKINEVAKPVRADPMAFSSILSSTTVDPPRSSATSEPPYKHKGQSLKTPNGDASAGVGMTASTVVTPTNTSPRKSLLKSPPPQDHEPLPRDQVKEHPKSKGSKNILSAKLVSTTSDKENESVQQALAEINAKELSDVDAPGWTNEKEKYRQVSQKRQLRVGENEASRRKRRRTTNTTRVSTQMNTFVKQGREGFKHFNEDAAVAEVQQKEILDEKERKKDMQRKRRREKTIQNETQKQREAIERAQLATDNAVREKLLKEAHKAEKKAKSTKRILDTGDLSESIREVTPLALNLEGGTMSTFQTSSQISPEPPRKRAKGPAIRPKKSKEKKQAEIQAAEQGYALEQMERENPVLIAPKEENRRETLMRETKESRAHKDTLSAPTVTNYASKGYQQIYDQIWKDIARKDIPKVFRIKENSLATKQSNMRKTAQLAAKEARRWQLRTNKSTKDVQARAKRSMREMMGFWKRNEREERDMRRIAEKQELDNAKKAEADREANRQRRKLNFLISQTELYSHFVGNKVKTDDIERSTDSPDVVTSRQIVAPGKPEPRAIALPGRVGQAGTKVMNFEDLDFDAEDETELENAAAANAQIALQEAQDKARAFNGDTNALQAQFDDSDMNFMEPTSLGAIDVQQPAMLNAQLKEYQLKGLKWLVNLYEQGINGILADEMGLGKTVQSISVMAYLAEKHNIWGPFLVIAPASTLHNWQQEISRFVPSLTVLPYWGTAKDRKVLRKDWDRKHITYTKESKFHVLVTSYQLVVMDTQYFQKIKWQYMILDEAQAIKSSSSSRWKSLLGFQCRNRLLLTGTPIQNNMQELWALLHFIMPTLFDSHDEFSDWFSKDIESHAQSNTKLNEDQLKRLHMILKPFMLRRIKKNVQKELGDKIEVDVFCDLTYRQRAYYANLRNKISIMDLIEKAAVGDDQDTATLMNLVMQFRKVCNHPDLFERADTSSPLSMAYFAETASFMREGHNINVAYSTRNLIEYDLPRLLCSPEARLEIAGPGNEKAGFKKRYLRQLMNIWTPEYIQQTSSENQAFSWLRFADTSAGEAYEASHNEIFMRAMQLTKKSAHLEHCKVMYHGSEDAEFTPVHALFNIVERSRPEPLANTTNDGLMRNLLDVSRNYFEETGLRLVEPCARPAASAPPIEVVCSNQATGIDNSNVLFNVPIRKALYGFSEKDELALLEAKVDPNFFPIHSMLPAPMSESARFTNIQVPSMRRFVTDSGKLAKLDQLLRDLKNGDHRVLLYFQMTRMIDLMEEYLTYRGYKYLRLDGSTKLEDRRDTVSDFQTRNDIFIFLLSTRAGGLGINLTAADTVIFYDSDWNPTIDSQAMDRAHRLGQTRQVTVYRMITRGTIEERIRKRALQKEEVQRVVIAGGSGAGVDFNTRSKENRTKDIAMWLADDEQAELIEKKEKEVAEKVEEVKKGVKRKATGGRKKDVSLDDMYHEGEGHFDDGSNKPSGAATPIDAEAAVKGAKKGPGKGKGLSKKAKTAKQRLAIADAAGDLGMSGM